MPTVSIESVDEIFYPAVRFGQDAHRVPIFVVVGLIMLSYSKVWRSTGAATGSGSQEKRAPSYWVGWNDANVAEYISVLSCECEKNPRNKTYSTT